MHAHNRSRGLPDASALGQKGGKGYGESPSDGRGGDGGGVGERAGREEGRETEGAGNGTSIAGSENGDLE